MDDMWLFDNDQGTLVSDFLLIQSLLGDRGLSVNDKKSSVLEGLQENEDLPGDLDEMKISLLRRRREELRMGRIYGDDEENDDDPDDLEELSEEEQAYLVSLLNGERIQEEDAELVLTLMRDHSSDVMEFLPGLIEEFPSLVKRIYHFCSNVSDTNGLVSVLLHYLAKEGNGTEYQLFWFAKMAEDYLMKTSKAGDLLRTLYEHDRATDISRAKILEIPSKRFGLPDLREEHLRSGHSGWLAWSAAVGARGTAKGQRNQLLKYFRKASSMNQLIGDFVETCF